jgi:hypothetical protein
VYTRRLLHVLRFSLTFKVLWLLYVPPGSTFNTSTFCLHSAYISEQTLTGWFSQPRWTVYCAVRTGSLNETLTFVLKGWSKEHKSSGNFKTNLSSFTEPKPQKSTHLSTWTTHNPTDHAQWHIKSSLDSSVREISPWQRPLPDNTQHSQLTDINTPGGIRTRNPSKRSAADPRFRPPGPWNRLR